MNRTVTGLTTLVMRHGPMNLGALREGTWRGRSLVKKLMNGCQSHLKATLVEVNVVSGAVIWPQPQMKCWKLRKGDLWRSHKGDAEVARDLLNMVRMS